MNRSINIYRYFIYRLHLFYTVQITDVLTISEFSQILYEITMLLNQNGLYHNIYALSSGAKCSEQMIKPKNLVFSYFKLI